MDPSAFWLMSLPVPVVTLGDPLAWHPRTVVGDPRSPAAQLPDRAESPTGTPRIVHLEPVGPIRVAVVLPALTLGTGLAAILSRMVRSSLLEVLGEDYIRTARAKGLSPLRVLVRHGLRNAWLPVLTVLGMQLGALLGGAVVTETVFNWPGMGTLAFDAILRRDYTTMLGVLFFASAMVVIANLLTDLSYRLADPRLRGKS